MKSKRKLMLGAVAGLALAGAGGGLAATTGHGAAQHRMRAAERAGRGDMLAVAADYLGITTAQLLSDLQSGQTLAQVASATSGKSADGLIAALVGSETQELDAAVSAGRLTQAQEQELLANLQQHVTDLVDGTRPPGGPGFGRGHGPGDDIAAAASYLGITTAQLLSDLQSGQTLAQVASATSGKSADGLIAALVSSETQELDAAVAAGKLTSAQEQELLANLQQHVTDLVNGVRPAGSPPKGYASADPAAIG
jgi:urease accessory protein UreF